MFPGVVTIALAAVAFGACRRTAPHGIRRMLATIGATSIVLSLGMLTPIYGALALVLPPLLGVRQPSRFGVLAVFALAVLAGIGWKAVRARLAPRWQTAAAAGLLALATVESLHAPIPYRPLTPDEWYPPIYRALEMAPPGPIAELPITTSGLFHLNAKYLLASTRHWQPIVNGFGGFRPETYDATVRQLATFPSDEAVAHLRSIGVHSVNRAWRLDLTVAPPAGSGGPATGRPAPGARRQRPVLSRRSPKRHQRAMTPAHHLPGLLPRYNPRT